MLDYCPSTMLCLLSVYNCLIKILSIHQSSSVQFSPGAQSCPTLCNPMDCSTPGFPVLHQLPEFTLTHVHSVGDAIQPFHLLSSPSPPALNVSQHQGLFQWVSSCIRWLKYWSFSFSICPSNEYSGLISLRIDWLDQLLRLQWLKCSKMKNAT